jgi:eukaryotic-like serine/threonine-protein kinase
MLHSDHGDAPSVACVAEACYVAWQEEPKGVWFATVDHTQGKRITKRLLSAEATRPSLAISPKGEVVVAFYEKGKVKIATISRDGVGVQSVFAKLSGDPPRPAIVPGKARGEWYVGWLDVEAAHTEVYIARLSCPR